MESHATYLEWNNKIAAHFFRPEMAGQPVHLYVTAELINDLQLGTLKDFLTAVKAGPDWAPPEQTICQKAYQSYQSWRARAHKHSWLYPPYIGYLALFVLAAGVEGNFAPHAYYPRLRNLLGESPGSTLYYFDRMLELWSDLEQWSNQDMHGRFGVFTSTVAGSWIHVGLPIAQTILTEHERKSLPEIFAEAALDPASPPSDAELAMTISKYGADRLRSRTVHLLRQRGDDQSLYEVLIENIKDELSAWDGSNVEVAGQESGVTPRIYGNLRICLALDDVAQRVQALVRCSVNREYPDEGLVLQKKRSHDVFFCEEDLPGWSSPLRYHGTGVVFDASTSNWVEGLEFQDETSHWKFKLTGSPIRVFISGSRERISGLIEVHQIPRAAPFYIVAADSAISRLLEWAPTGCKGFKEKILLSGLPPGWRLFSIAEALTDEPIRKHYPVLSFANVVRLLVRGGIRSSQGNVFFPFAPPEVLVEGGNGTERVFCGDTELPLNSGTGTYTLPPDLPTDTRLVITVRRGDDTLKQRTFYLSSNFRWQGWEPETFFNRFGQRVSESTPEEPSVAGAYVKNLPVQTYRFQPHFSSFDADEVYCIGQIPGQIVLLTDEFAPEAWSPVWIVAMKKQKGSAVFCGVNIDASRPLVGKVANPKDLKLWKEVLWHWRKKIAPQSHPGLRTLWKEFREVARHA